MAVVGDFEANGRMYCVSVFTVQTQKSLHSRHNVTRLRKLNLKIFVVLQKQWG